MATSVPPPPPPKPNKNKQFTNNSATTLTNTANNITTNHTSLLDQHNQTTQNNKILYNNNLNDSNIIKATSNHANNITSVTPTFGYSNNNNNISSNSLKSSTPPPDDEQVVMTPKGKTSNSTILLIERKLVEQVSDRVHVAGGDHRGIIINKEAIRDQKSVVVPPQLSLEFRVFLVSANTGQHSQESRCLRFWFRSWVTDTDKQAHVAQDFFRELVSPKEFPRDYVGFIKKIMKLLQKGYNEIQSLEIELRILEQTSAPPSRPLSIEDSQFVVAPLTPEKILELIEQAYPNPITPEDLARDNGWTEAEVLQIMLALQTRGLIKSMEFNAFTRIHHEDTEIKVVKQMPTIASNKQPTIAIITAQYCEKLAVDSMLENKETFVRYTTVGTSPEKEKDLNTIERRTTKFRRFGESNVYTLGNIGAHRIVSTKLPSVGGTREATTAAGNTTTRLLGTFQKVDFVFLVGVAGGIPHYTDYKKHVRLGDVVISCMDTVQQQQQTNGHVNGDSGRKATNSFCYIYNGGEELKKYYPKNAYLQDIARSLYAAQMTDGTKPWEHYMQEGFQHLQNKVDTDFSRPAANTDKLYMNIGNRDVIEVAHPISHDSQDNESAPATRLHLGPIGCGRDLLRSDNLRTDYAKKFGLIATDVELKSVLDSVVGNCRDSFIVVKGIADYKDGVSTKRWHTYSSLAAAAITKTIICGMNAPTNV